MSQLTIWFLWLALVSPAPAQSIGSFVSPGSLARPHAELDTLTGCPSCHAPGQGPTPSRCMACHDSVAEQVRRGEGFHGRQGRGERCGECHPDHRGRDHQLVVIPENFSHRSETGFPLEGAHAPLSCRRCHQEVGRYDGLSPECVSCHEGDAPHGLRATSRPQLLRDCARCHDAADWEALPLARGAFDHDAPRQADYALTGAHADVGCAECHLDWQFVPVPSEACTDCHINPHRAPFREQPCGDCHETTETFFVDAFDHTLTGYPHEGRHRGLGCEQCHTGISKTEPLSRECVACHPDPHRGQFGARGCDDCHTVFQAAFLLPDFDHDTTAYPLQGQHVEVTCAECHGEGGGAQYVGLPFGDCDDCHDDAHEGRHEPVPCTRCHVEDGFDVQFFDHDTTSFPHTGKHIGLACEKCHRPGDWSSVPHGSCNDCHYPTNPHDADAVGVDQCAECHDTTGFASISFDHLGETGFDLAPAHTDTRCIRCHQGVEVFAGLEPSCEGCHDADRPWGHYEGECEACHQAARWFPAGLGDRDHAVTGFALRGVHSLQPCESCHAPGRPRGEAAPGCQACHSADDPHRNMIGMACTDCHGESTWLRTTFRHHQTGWSLRGAHRLAACIDCHALQYVGTPTECVRCHEVDAFTQGAGVPEHFTPSVRTCDRCHRQHGWLPATFPH